MTDPFYPVPFYETCPTAYPPFGPYQLSDAGLVDLLDAALEAILVADSLDMAQGIAHAALNREEYHGHEVPK